MGLFQENKNPQKQTVWKDGYVFWGIVLGLMTGAFVRLWNSHKSGDEVREEILDRIEPGHSLDNSLQEGKAAARRFQTPVT